MDGERGMKEEREIKRDEGEKGMERERDGGREGVKERD